MQKMKVNVEPCALSKDLFCCIAAAFRAEIHLLWSLMGKKKDIKGIYCEKMDLIPSNPFFGIKLGILFLWSLELDYAGVTNQSMWVSLQDEVELWIEPSELLAQNKAADEFTVLFLIMQDLQASIKTATPPPPNPKPNPKQKKTQTRSSS